RVSFRRGATRGDFGRAFDSCTNPEVRRTAAKIASHRAVDLIVVRTWVALEQRRGRHDLARLAVTALRHIELAPGLLQRVCSCGIKALDRGHRLSAHRRDLSLAGACW